VSDVASEYFLLRDLDLQLNRKSNTAHPGRLGMITKLHHGVTTGVVPSYGLARNWRAP
jgi:hypothetical protein